MEAVLDPRHPEHRNHPRWCGGEFDPNRFDIYAANVELLKYLRWSRPRA